MNWYREHSDPFGFADVNTPDDLLFAEWVLSGSYGLSKFDKEAKELKIPLEKLIWMRFREYAEGTGKKAEEAS